MRFSRARYVTLCQQSLVTAAVLAVGVSAAGVKTLDIVPQPGQTADLGAGAPGAQPRQALGQDTEPPAKTEVDAAPVTPKVREVKVSGISGKGAEGRPDHPTSARQAPPKANEHDGADSTRSPRSPSELVALSEPEPVRGYATVGVTWKHGTDIRRRPDRRDGAHRGERHVVDAGSTADYHDEHGPDAGSAEEDAARERPGTDALVVGDVDRVQMRAETTDGSTPPDLKLAVIDPGTGAMTKEAPAIDTAKLDSPRARATARPAARRRSRSGHGSEAGSDVQDTVALSAMKTAPRPKIYSRAQWGANERMREQAAPDYGTVKAGFIHHTVNSNSYSVEPGAVAAARHLRLPHAVPWLARHRLQLPRRPVRPDLGRPLRRRRPRGRRSPHPGLQRGLLRAVGDRQLRHRVAADRRRSVPTPGCSPGSSRSTTSGRTTPGST